MGIVPIAKILLDEDSTDSSNQINEINIKKLNSCIEKFDSYNSDIFLDNLILMLKKEEWKISNDDIFWTDLAELLLKIIFSLKQKMINASKDEFELVSKKIRSIDSMNQEFSIIRKDFNLETMKFKDFNESFLDFQFLNHSDRISKEFIKALDYAYSSLFITDKESEKERIEKLGKFDCKAFKKKFFKNGNLDNDMFLKFFMSKNDDGEIIRAYLESNTQLPYSKVTEESIKQIKDYIHMLKNGEIRYFRENPRIFYAGKSAIKSIISKRRKLLMINKNDPIELFIRVDQVGLLTKENIMTIAGFLDFDDSIDEIKWNQNKFEEYLREYGEKSFNVTFKDIELINKCFKLFELKPLKENPYKNSFWTNFLPISMSK